MAVPLAIERIALGRMSTVDVVRVGAGFRRAERSAAGLAGRFADPSGPPGLAVVGVAGGLRRDLRPGDLVVADEVRGRDGVVACPTTHIAADLRAVGLTVHIGPMSTVDHLVDGAERTQLGRTGSIAVDMESAPLVHAAALRPWVVVRAIADTPDRPLRSAHTVTGGINALRSLRAVAPVLERWALTLTTKEVG